MGERSCQTGGLEFAYEQFGDPADPELLLVMGLNTQMVGWPAAFCEQLAERGFHVTRFDNRDCGRSTILRELGAPRAIDALLGRPGCAKYPLEDMADDAIALMDALGIERAHIVGASMGGMISQLIAIRHPERVLSLCSIMSNTGRRSSGGPSPILLPQIGRRPPRDREKLIDHTVLTFKAIGSKGELWDEEVLREIAAQSFDRGLTRSGSLRQLAAITTARDRTPGLRSLRMPVLVLHGSRDPLVHRSGGRATARAIPGARYREYRGMGHDLPPALWTTFIDEITHNAARAGTEAAVRSLQPR